MYARYENITAVLTKTSVLCSKTQCIHVYGYDVEYICVRISTFQSSLLPWSYENPAVICRAKGHAPQTNIVTKTNSGETNFCVTSSTTNPR